MFKQRKHKTFNTTSVFSKENNTDEKSVSSNKNEFISKWKRENGGDRKVKGTMSLPILILALVLLLICMYVLDSKFN